MVISHLAASIAAQKTAQHRINPLRIVTESDIWEQEEPLPIDREDTEKMILEKFDTYFEMFDKFLNVLISKADEEDEKNGYTNNVKRLENSIDTLKAIAPKKLKEANFLLKETLYNLSDDTLNDVFCTVCEDPF